MKFFIFTFLFLFIFILSVLFFVENRTYSTVSDNVTQQEFIVNPGDDIITIGRELSDQNLITNRFYFYYYAWKNKLRGTIHAGKYLIEPKSTIEEIVYKMTEGDEIVQKKKDIKITFPEGWTFSKMAQRLNANNLPGDEFERIAKNPPQELYEKYTFLPKGETLEGYLFPDTYFFMPDAQAMDIIEKMLTNFDNKVDEGRRAIIEQQGRNLHDVIIFASVIEGEVPTDKDRAIVAGIFQNRLDIGMALQSDATIDYIKGTPEIKHTQADTEIDSPYNTYKYPGLPAGPINNPSLASIDAAIAPADTEYMYFLNHAETGETVFSKTFDEHVMNKGQNGL
jgi:UPF0755 protein